MAVVPPGIKINSSFKPVLAEQPLLLGNPDHRRRHVERAVADRDFRRTFLRLRLLANAEGSGENQAKGGNETGQKDYTSAVAALPRRQTFNPSKPGPSTLRAYAQHRRSAQQVQLREKDSEKFFSLYWNRGGSGKGSINRNRSKCSSPSIRSSRPTQDDGNF